MAASAARLVLVMLYVFCLFLDQVVSIRIDDLKETDRDSTTITIQWSYDKPNDVLFLKDWIGYKIKYMRQTPSQWSASGTIESKSSGTVVDEKAIIVTLANINETKYVLDKLTPNTEYRIQISAFKYDNEEGPSSNVIAVKTTETVPGAPQDIRIGKVTRTSFDVEWKPPKRNEEYGLISGYQIIYFKSNSQINDDLVQQQTEAVKKIKIRNSILKYTIGNLEPGSTYKLQIFAYNPKGDGTRSSTLIVNTLDDLPAKPENLRAQIYNDELHIQWSKSNSPIDGYRLYFNDDPYNLDAKQNEFIIRRPKWDFNQQYDIRISAKSSKNNSVYGEEAIYRIKTQESSKKLNLVIDKLTSTTALLKWQQIKFDETNKLSKNYKIEYYLKEDPGNVKKLTSIEDKTEYLMDNLEPTRVYIVQLVAYDADTSQNEETIIYFQTLGSDMQAPKNLKLERMDQGKIRLKWDAPDLLPNERIKSFKVYISEAADTGFFNWEPVDLNENTNNEMLISALDSNKKFAFKVVAIDDKNREGAESNIVYFNNVLLDEASQSRTGTTKSSKHAKPKQPSVANLQTYQLNTNLSQPRDVQTLEINSTSIKFAWWPPINTQLPVDMAKRLAYRIFYIDKPKRYKDVDGLVKTYQSQNQFNVKIDPFDDTSMRITWLITGLNPDTEYDFNISCVLGDAQGPPVTRTILTKRDRPVNVDRPQVKEIFDDNTVLLQLGNGSEKNGPISKYWLVVVPFVEFAKYDRMTVELASLHELTEVSLKQAETWTDKAYVAAEFDAKFYPQKFVLGDGRLFGRFKNRLLKRGLDYKLFTIAFTRVDSSSKQKNRIELDSVVAQFDGSTFDSLTYEANTPYTASQLSDVFNTKSIEVNKALKKPLDYQNYAWILAVISVLVIVMIVVVVVIGLKVKKNDCFLLAKNSTNTMAKHHHLSRQMNDDDEDDDGDQLDNNKATLIPPIQTNTTTSTSSMVTTSIYNNNNNNMNGQPSTMYNPKSATISPHVQQQQQYLSATLHRNHHHHHNQMVGTMGLLTTVHTNTPQTAESLYTSIDATQRQHLLSNYGTTSTTSKALFSTYDPHTGTLNNQTMPTHGTLPHCHNPIEDLKRLKSLQAQQQQQPIGQKTLVKLDDLSDYIDTLKQNQNERFQAEYESIEPNEQFTWDNSTKDYNRHKNRYANVIAYDHSRVVLAPLYDHHTRSILVGSDYINANFIDGYRRRNAYIATQGPLPSTYTDFWRMVWEQNTSIIVMMTKLEERNRLKCDQYWPNKGMDVYGNLMQVTLVDITELATHTIRTFILARIGSNEPKREIKQFQYTAWPDHGVPEPTTSFLVFLRRIAYATASMQQHDALMGPVVVHCSAGVGRTGCFVVVNAMLERAVHDKTVDVYDYVTQLRAQRNYMVQTEDQYQFCYDAILEALQCGKTDVHARNLYQHLEALLQTVDENSPLTEMELEYKRLSNVKAPHTKFHSANMPCNKYKNRLVNILPYESTRVCLSVQQNSTTGQLVDGSDYVNANFIDGYKFRKAYIATQAPLPETVDDFWRMLWETNSTIVVMLTKLREMGREKCAQYWPSECSIRYQNFVVDPIAEYNMSQYILREFKITDARDGQSRTIRQFQYCDWPEQGVPKSGESIIELIGQVHKTKDQFGQMGPITVHCSAGVGRTGVFITLSVVLERMRYEGMIDVFNTVKMLRTQRPAMVQTEDQYQFCYRAALEYLGSFDNYET